MNLTLPERVAYAVAQAEQKHKVKEIANLCEVTVHTVAVAINKHKDKACSCGASMVFIESRHQNGFDMATATLIAFRVVKPAIMK